jgi:hypothetical protein
MTEYSVEEVRNSARLLDGLSRRMLNDYADLREQIERARDGVTAEVCSVLIRSQRPFGEVHPSDYERMREALQSIAHLLPSERGGVDEGMVDRYLATQSETIHRLDSQWGTCAGGSNFVREACKAGLSAALSHPPAQAAQVDAACEWQVQTTCCGMDTGVSYFHTWKEADDFRNAYTSGPGVSEHGYSALQTSPEHRRSGVVKRVSSPTAEPVAQGEAVACWRYRNMLGEVVSEWIDGKPPERLFDLCGNELVGCTVEVAYSAQPRAALPKETP